MILLFTFKALSNLTPPYLTAVAEQWKTKSQSLKHFLNLKQIYIFQNISTQKNEIK